MPTCHACGGHLPDGTLTCPHCRASVRERGDSGTANVIALIVVIVLLVIVGHDALAPAAITKPAGAGTPSASRAAPAKAMQRSSLMEHAPASQLERGLERAQRAGAALHR